MPLGDGVIVCPYPGYDISGLMTGLMLSELAIAYCHGIPLCSGIEAMDPGGLDMATARATTAIAARFGVGEVEGRIRGLVTTAR